MSKICQIYLFQLILAVTVSLPFWQRQANALPTEIRTFTRRDVPADDISMYTTQYFLDQHIFTPPPSSCLFYTFDLTPAAQNYSKGGENELTTIWDIWPCDLYNGNTTDTSNSLRDIMKNNQPTYFENMSRAMAQLCDVYALVMTKDPTNVPTTGIWGRIEFPTLMQSGNVGGEVITVDACDVKGSSIEPQWQRPGTKKREESSDYHKRQTVPIQPLAAQCYSSYQLGLWFGGIDW